jgi:hypothetical protein
VDVIRRLVACLAIGLLVVVVAAGCNGDELNTFRAQHGLAPLTEPQLSQGVTFVNAWLAEAQRRNSFTGDIGPVDLARLGLSYRPGCPVGPADLRLLRLSYWGFDDTGHVGEMIVNVKIANQTVAAFHDMWNAKFPINRMDTSDKFLTAADFDPSGNYIETNVPDTVNDSSGFMCRPVTAGTTFSQHAYGMAIDINPLENPEISGSLVVPINGVHNPAVTGTIVAGSAAERAMASHGFIWGGTWKTMKDFMHFSPNGH